MPRLLARVDNHALSRTVAAAVSGPYRISKENLLGHCTRPSARRVSYHGCDGIVATPTQLSVCPHEP
jgi:hypothetical protein